MDAVASLYRWFLGAPLLSMRAGAGVLTGLIAAAGVSAGAPFQPLFLVLGAAAIADWAVGLPGAEDRLEGFAVGALVGLAAARGLFAGAEWDAAGCRTLTGDAWRAAVPFASAPLGLTLAGRRLIGPTRRTAAAVLLIGGCAVVAFALAPACFQA